jgi:imidazolonepropionase-like amidohydrolase
MQSIVIKNARIYTMANQDVLKGEILLVNGKVKEVGTQVKAPEGAKVINARNHFVTPGLIDAHCHIGMIEDAIGFEGSDVNEAISPNTSQVRGIDGFNPMDRTVKEALAGGVITAATGPGSANVLGGTFFACKLHGDCVDDMIIKDPIAMKAPLVKTQNAL